MNIPYPCPKPLEEMKSTKNGFYCNDCGHTLIDLRAENGTLPPKGSCVVSYEEVEDEKSAEINTSYRFALALFIVMGSSMILNNSTYSQEFITSINEIKENSLKVDSNYIYLKGQITDENGNYLKNIKIKITLANGQIINYKPEKRNFYSLQIPSHQLNKTITLDYYYYNEVYTLKIIIIQNIKTIPIVKFKRNNKDKLNKKSVPMIEKTRTGRFL
jgi:hypothetical protein